MESQVLKSGCEKLGIFLNEKQESQFIEYYKMLIEWNQVMNLTAITEYDEVMQKHFVDSLSLVKGIDLSSCETLIDIGTGAGFPGIPLKIIREDIEITLLDSLNKRVIFLEEILRHLKLTKVEAIHSRVEEFGKNQKNRESFDYATSRAVAKLSTLSEYLMPLVKIQGNCICMKGPKIEEEVEESKKAISILGGKIEKIDHLQLPEGNMDRTIVVMTKVKPTPLKYPRKPGMATKEPIQ